MYGTDSYLGKVESKSLFQTVKIIGEIYVGGASIYNSNRGC